MDFHGMKRKKLQSLCKKHGIPANLKNKDMADRLSLLLNQGKENDVSCHTSSNDAGTDQGNSQCDGDKHLLYQEIGELNSNYVNNEPLVATDTVAAGSVNASEQKFVSSGKRSPSPNLEERVGFSPKHLKSSEVKGLENEISLSPEITRDDDDVVEICDVEENMQGGDNKEQVDVMELMEDEVDIVNVAMEKEESGKLLGNGNAGDEVTNQDETNTKDLSPLLVSPDEYGKPLVEGEVQKSVDNVCIHGEYSVVIKEQVESSEFGNCLVEGEVEDFGNKTDDAQEEICGAESEKQDNTNRLQGSDMNDNNLPRVSLEESGYALVDAETQKLDETVCVHGGVYNNFQDSGSEVDTVCFVDTSIAAKDSNDKTNVTKHPHVELHSSSFECSDQFLTINQLSEAKSSDLNIRQMVVSGNAPGNVDASEAKVDSSSKISLSPDSGKIIGFSADLLNETETKGSEFEKILSSETQKDDIEMCDVEENIQSDVREDHVDENQELLHAAPSAVVMNNVDLVQDSSEVLGNNLMQRESENLGDKTDLSEGVFGTGKGAAEAEIHDDTDSPQLSNMDYLNPDKSGYPLVEGEVLKPEEPSFVHDSVQNIENSVSENDLMCLLDSYIDSKDSDGNTNVTADHFPDQVHSSNFEYSDDMSDLFPATFPPSEVKSTYFNIHEMVASDTKKEKLASSQKKNLMADPKECIDFLTMHLEASDIKEFETQTNFNPSTLGDIVGTCDINESMEIIKTDTVSGDEDLSQKKLKLSPKCTPVADSEKRSNFFPKVLESSMMKKELEGEKKSTMKTARDILGTCDMKENFSTAKKEQFGSRTFTKRQPLQDLQQN